MPFTDIEQPEIIHIDHTVRLRKYDGNHQIAIPWYQDEVVRRFSEGVEDANILLDATYVSRKLDWLNTMGEVYFIEAVVNDDYLPIGVVTLKEDNPPIEIGNPRYRGKGIGKKVMKALLNRAREIGIKKIYNTGCYEDNIACQKMLEAVGFTLAQHDQKERRKIFEIILR